MGHPTITISLSSVMAAKWFSKEHKSSKKISETKVYFCEHKGINLTEFDSLKVEVMESNFVYDITCCPHKVSRNFFQLVCKKIAYSNSKADFIFELDILLNEPRVEIMAEIFPV